MHATIVLLFVLSFAATPLGRRDVECIIHHELDVGQE